MNPPIAGKFHKKFPNSSGRNLLHFVLSNNSLIMALNYSAEQILFITDHFPQCSHPAAAPNHSKKICHDIGVQAYRFDNNRMTVNNQGSTFPPFAIDKRYHYFVWRRIICLVIIYG
mmetsp:Transcript_28169/g.37565  ORF Transcript_28169/g.37565 Transcript_28169/m.37565 type:complete len:116 (+) Transcript_28169:31-378(+)